MEPWTLGWPFHRSVKASVVLAVEEGNEAVGSGAKESRGKGLCRSKREMVDTLLGGSSIGEQGEKEEEGEWGEGSKEKAAK